MRIVVGYERLTVTLANVARAITLRPAARVSILANGVPMGMAARFTIAETCPGGAPTTLTDLATSTGLNSTSHPAPAINAKATKVQAANSQGRRRTRAARASKRDWDEGNPEERRAGAPRRR